MDFPTAEKFTEAEIQPCIKWRDLPLDIYKIKSRLKTHSKFGDGMRLELENHQQQTYFVWAPARLVKISNEDLNTTTFVKNNGLKTSDYEPNKKYYSFSTI